MSDEVCLRNMSCTCKLCAGFDVDSLLSINRSISSNIVYGDPSQPGNKENAPPTAPVVQPGVVTSPPVPAAKKAAAKAAAKSKKKSKVGHEPKSNRSNIVESSSKPESMEDITADEPVPMAIESTSNDENVEMSDATPSSSSPEDLVNKINDKNWKIRKEAYEQVKTMCEQPGTSSDQIRSLLESFVKMCEDSNASALEAGFQAVLAYTMNIQPFQKSIVSGVMKRIVDKGLSGRPGTVKLCEELVTAFIEAGAVEETIDALVEGTKNKKPKVPPACVNCILENLKAFGPRVIPVQTLKNALPSLCESTVNGVRPLALNILAEIHRWIGPTLIQDIVSNLRQAQQTEYETLTKEIVVGQVAPTKFVRGAKNSSGPAASGSRKQGSKAQDTTAGNASVPGGGAFDPREFAETVNLLDKLPKTEFKSKLDLPKWSEKVEALKIVLDLIGPVPKLSSQGDYFELVNTLKILSQDSNVNIVAKSIEVLGALCDGLRKNFTPYAKLMFPILMNKLSDKKNIVINSVNNSLDMFYLHALTMDYMMEEIKIGLDPSKNKAPSARVQTLNFLGRCVDKKREDKNMFLELANLVTNAMEDVDPSVRKAAIETFVLFHKAGDENEKVLSPLMGEISRRNSRTFKSIQQCLAGEELSSSMNSNGPRSNPKNSMKEDSSSTSTSSRTGLGNTRKSSSARAGGPSLSRASITSKAPGTKAATSSTTSKTAASGTANIASSSSSNSDFNSVGWSVSVEEATDILENLGLDNWSEVQEQFESSKWLDRKSALESFETIAQNYLPDATEPTKLTEALIRYVSNQVKDFKDSNINVLKAAFQCVGVITSQTKSRFPKSVITNVVPNAIDKIGDKKATEIIRSMLLDLCEAASPSYVIGCILNHLPNVKTPLAHLEVVNFFIDCIKDFGLSVCNPRAIVEFSKSSQALESSNVKVRSAAVSLLGVMYSQLGPSLLPILNLDSWKPALKSTIENEFEKVGFDVTKSMASIKRQVKPEDGTSSISTSNNHGGGSGGIAAMFGRVDISNQITKELLNEMKNEDDKAAWKKRLAAMENVQSICEQAAFAIEYTKTITELFRALKPRLNDSNANLKAKAAQVIGIVAKSLDKMEIAKMTKILGANLVSGVSDNKKNMQLACLEALDMWVTNNPNGTTVGICMETLLPSLSEQLMNPVGRAELLNWAAKHTKASDKPLDLNSLVVPTIQSMMDKSSEAREKAQLLLIEVVKSVGKDAVMNGCRDVKPAQMRTLKPLLHKVFETATSNAASVPASTPVIPPALPIQAPIPPATAPPNAQTSDDSSLRSTRIARVNSTPVKPLQQQKPTTPGKNSTTSGMNGPGLQRMSRALSSSSNSCVTSSAMEIDADASMPLKVQNGKAQRLEKSQYTKWIVENTPTEINARRLELENDWRPFLNGALCSKLFSTSYERGGILDGISELSNLISKQPEEILACLDLILKWSCIRLLDNNVQALAKMLEFCVRLFEFLKARHYQLEDVEAMIFLPCLLSESGNSKPRFRVRFREIMRLCGEMFALDKYAIYLTECINNCKNTKSRSECIDLVGFLVSNSTITQSIEPLLLGKKAIVKEIGKLVTAHEKEVRENALNTLVQVFLKLRSNSNGNDLNMDKFFKLCQVTSQQGMDLLNARIKHLPATVVTTGATGRSVSIAAAAAAASAASAATTTYTTTTTVDTHMEEEDDDDDEVDYSDVPAPKMPPSSSSQASAAAVVAVQSQAQVQEEEKEEDLQIEEILLNPIDNLFVSSVTKKQIVDEQNPCFVEGINAIKAIYSIACAHQDEAELAFLKVHINVLLLKLCDCIHGAFWAGETSKPIQMRILSITFSTINALLKSEQEIVEKIQRFALERLLLEVCSKMLDPRLENLRFTNTTGVVQQDVQVRRYQVIRNALNLVTKNIFQRVKMGEILPCLVNLLQRIVRNDVGEYNSRDSYNELMEKICLDELIGRNLVNLCSKQANLVVPFETVDLFGIFMQMHSFFATFPQNDQFGLKNALENMEKTLFVIAKSMLNEGRLDSLLGDLPIQSPVREKIQQMGILLNQEGTIGTMKATTLVAVPVVPPSVPVSTADLKKTFVGKSSPLTSSQSQLKSSDGPQDDDVDMEVENKNTSGENIARKLWAEDPVPPPLPTSLNRFGASTSNLDSFKARAATIGAGTIQRPTFTASSSSKDLESLTSSNSSAASLSNLKDRLERIRTKHNV